MQEVEEEVDKNKKLNQDPKNIEMRSKILKDWSARSTDGKVCGIVGCNANPRNKCPICNHFYCTEHIKIHFHNSR